jgi:hypothetical protein
MGFRVRSFEVLFQIAEGLQLRAFVFADPALGDFVDGHRIEVMELFASAPDDCDKVRAFEQVEVFGHGLAGHGEVGTQVRERLPAAFTQRVEQLAAAPVGEGFEHFIHE